MKKSHAAKGIRVICTPVPTHAHIHGHRTQQTKVTHRFVTNSPSDILDHNEIVISKYEQQLKYLNRAYIISTAFASVC